MSPTTHITGTMIATDATAPSILFGLGIYPPKDTVDGFRDMLEKQRAESGPASGS